MPFFVNWSARCMEDPDPGHSWLWSSFDLFLGVKPPTYPRPELMWVKGMSPPLTSSCWYIVILLVCLSFISRYTLFDVRRPTRARASDALIPQNQPTTYGVGTFTFLLVICVGLSAYGSFRSSHVGAELPICLTQEKLYLICSNGVLHHRCVWC